MLADYCWMLHRETSLRLRLHQASRVASSHERHLMGFILTLLRLRRLRQTESSQYSETCLISWRMDAYSLAQVAALLWLRHRRRSKQRKRIWMHELNTKTPDFGSFCHLFPDMVNHPEKKFYNFFRITHENFKKLVELTGSSIKKSNTNCRRSVWS